MLSVDDVALFMQRVLDLIEVARDVMCLKHGVFGAGIRRVEHVLKAGGFDSHGLAELAQAVLCVVFHGAWNVMMLGTEAGGAVLVMG